MRLAISFLLLLLLAVVAQAQPVPLAPVVPKEPPSPKSMGLPEATSPMLGFFQGYDAKEKKFNLAFIDSMPEIDEKTGEQTWKPVVMANGVAEAEIKFYNTKGEKLKTDSVVSFLKKGDTIVVSGDEKPIPAAYLKVIKADAIVAVFPLDAFLASIEEQFFPPGPPLPPGAVPPAPVAPLPAAPPPAPVAPRAPAPAK
ncbi:hypothetical protein [Anatilimnocola floriformis]|uniref:hypothetical protein n=1 Tax=Anatilimnocola floriformis TaxID=2948575 RepID=UPI0020C4EE97|nr:hypothetical protein [Anatilimnocola floriformis]